jgi:hypothetical protein
MSNKDILSDLKKAKEEEYFRKKEQELIEKLRERTRLEEERKGLAAATGVADETVLQTLLDLGYTRDTVCLLHIVPLLSVAWAEGHITNRERAEIIEIARLRGVEPGSVADEQLEDWLDERPAEELFQGTLRVIGVLLGALPDEERQAARRDLVSFCTQVASTSGGILGLGGKIAGSERAIIERVASELASAHREAAERLVKE